MGQTEKERECKVKIQRKIQGQLVRSYLRDCICHYRSSYFLYLMENDEKAFPYGAGSERIAPFNIKIPAYIDSGF